MTGLIAGQRAAKVAVDEGHLRHDSIVPAARRDILSQEQVPDLFDRASSLTCTRLLHLRVSMVSCPDRDGVRGSVYMTLSYVASSLAPLELAAHQLVYSLWSLCSYATVPLEQVALAFVPVARGARRCSRYKTRHDAAAMLADSQRVHGSSDCWVETQSRLLLTSWDFGACMQVTGSSDTRAE